MKAVGVIDPANETAREINASRGAVMSRVLASVRAVNRSVESATDLGMDFIANADPPSETAPVPMRSDAPRPATLLGDAALGVLHGVVGDHLAASDNGLALEMSLRAGDRDLTVTPEGLSDGDPSANFGTMRASVAAAASARDPQTIQSYEDDHHVYFT